MNTFRYLHRALNQLALNLKVPGYSHHIQTLKRPNNPKVVVFGNSSRAYELISKQFSTFTHINGAETKGLDDNVAANKVAQSILQVNGGFQDGYFVTDFPVNATQAQRLDVITDGVNLALYIKDPTDKVTDARQNEAIQYYQKTGALVVVEVNPNDSLEEQVAALSGQVLNGYKL